MLEWLNQTEKEHFFTTKIKGKELEDFGVVRYPPNGFTLKPTTISKFVSSVKGEV